MTPVFETPEALLADYADRGKTLCANRYGFGQRIWQSRVETDRIVMELPAGDDGLPALAVLFDLDDDGQFAVTHLARGATAAPFTMTTQLFWQGDWRPTLRTQEGPATDDEGRFRPIEGWRRNILGEAARLEDPAAGRTIDILTSRPEIRIVRHDGQLALLCGDSRPAPLDDETSTAKKTSTGSERTIPPRKPHPRRMRFFHSVRLESRKTDSRRSEYNRLSMY